MDKYEYKVRSEEISKLIDKNEYTEAMKIADTIDWRRVKSITMLLKIAALYKVNRRLEDSKAVLMLAYERYPTNRSVVYSLCEISIELNDVVAAIEHYKQYMKLAPKENGVYILRYRILEISEASLEERIEILEELKKRDYQEEWAYELAYLYHRVGLATKCVEECDDIILWFSDGPYVMKAMELKKLHMPLTEIQQAKYDAMLNNSSEDFVDRNENEENYNTEYADNSVEYEQNGYNENAYGIEDYTQAENYENSYNAEAYSQNNNYDENAYGSEMYAQDNNYSEGEYGYTQENAYNENVYENDIYSQNNGYEEVYTNNNMYGSETYAQNQFADNSNINNEIYDDQNADYNQNSYENEAYGINGSYNEDIYGNETYNQNDNYNQDTYGSENYGQSGYVDDGYGNLSYIKNNYQDAGYTGEFYVEQVYDANGNLINSNQENNAYYQKQGSASANQYMPQSSASGNRLTAQEQRLLSEVKDQTSDKLYYNSTNETDYYGNNIYENNNINNTYEDNNYQSNDYQDNNYQDNNYQNNNAIEQDILQNINYKGITPVQDIHSNLAVGPSAENASSSDMSQYNTINLQKVVAESMKEIFPDDDAFEEERERINAEELANGDTSTNTIIYGSRLELENGLKNYTNPQLNNKIQEQNADIDDEIFDVSGKKPVFTTTGRLAQMVTGVSEVEPVGHDTGAIKKVIIPGDDARVIKEEPDMRTLLDTTEKTVGEEHARMENNDENVYHEKNIFDMHINDDDKPKPLTGQMRIKEVLEEWERKKLDNAKKHQEEIKQRVLTQTGRIFAEFDNSIKSGILGELEREEEENRKREEKSDHGFLEADVTSDLTEMQDEKNPEEEFDVKFVSEDEKVGKLENEQKEEYITELERAVARELGMQTKEISRLELFEAFKKKQAQQQEMNKIKAEDEYSQAEINETKNIEPEKNEKQQFEEIHLEDINEEADKNQEEVISKDIDEKIEENQEEEDKHEVNIENQENTISQEDYGEVSKEQQKEEISQSLEQSNPNDNKNCEDQDQEKTKRLNSIRDIYEDNENIEMQKEDNVLRDKYKNSRNLETKRIDDIIRSGYIAAQSVIHHGQIEQPNKNYAENSFVRNSNIEDRTVQLDVNEVIGNLHGTKKQINTNTDNVNDSYDTALDDAFYDTSDETYNKHDIYNNKKDIEYQEPIYDARARYERDMEVELDPEDAESIAEMAKEDALKTQEIRMNTADLSTLSEKIVATTKKEATGARREEIRDFTVDEQTLFENFAVTKKIKKQIIYALDNMTLAAYTGNVIITGDAGIDTVRMAKNLMKVYQDYDGNFSGKAAKITGEKLNQRNLREIFAKLNNGGIIIEKANGMSEEKLYEMSLLLNQESIGIVVIMEDTKKEITKLLEKQAMIVDYFNIRIDLMEMDNNALVAYAKNYALALEYSIDELGILALYTRIANMQSGNHVVTKDEVRDIIDEAIYKSKKSKIKNFVDVLFARRYDNEDMIVLKERDFI